VPSVDESPAGDTIARHVVPDVAYVFPAASPSSAARTPQSLVRRTQEEAMDNTDRRPSVSSAICYKDPKAALKWLEEVFGFEPYMVMLGPNDELAHAEMRFGDGLVMVSGEWSPITKSPQHAGGVNTQMVHVQLTDSVDAHCERARQAGAVIQMEPTTQFYGDRTYRAVDPEGHVWSFGQTITRMTSDEWDKAMGITTRTRL
jgi:uncharacterized glyoxalase superfamily protein PhnB